MNRLFRTTVVEISGVRTIAGGGTNASNAGQALLNLSGVSITGDQTISGNKIFGTNNRSLTTLSSSPILGGNNNLITGTSFHNFIVNGSSNIITGTPSNSFILNGQLNRIALDTDYSYISNGLLNKISGSAVAMIHNGLRNIIDDSSDATIGNGNDNCITGGSGSCFIDILNGASNTIGGSHYSSILQGTANYLGRSCTGINDPLPKACLSTIVNGSNNQIIGAFNLVGGGSFNQITGGLIYDGSCQSSSRSNVIVGGANNSISNSSCSAILGGRYNEIIDNGATVIGDGSLNVKTSRGTCSLLLSFQGGIHLESPNSGIDLNNSKLINAVPEFNNFTANFSISGNQNNRILIANSASQITGTIAANNPTGFNTTVIQVGNGKILITGSVNILSYFDQYRTAGIGAAISVLHTGNNGYIMYGNTSL
jgi:hypothetical protein